LWEVLRFQKAAKRLFRANLRSVRIQSISSPLMDSIGAVAIAMMLFIGRTEILHGHMTMGLFGAFIILLFKLLRSGSQVRLLLQTASSRPWARRASIFTFFDTEDDVKERTHPAVLKDFKTAIPFLRRGLLLLDRGG